DLYEHDWYAAGGSQQRPHDRGAYGEDDFRRERNQFRRVGIAPPGIDCAQAVVDLQVTSDVPSQFPKSLQERGVAGEWLRVVRGQASEHADPPHPLALLRARRERPRDHRAAEQRDELASAHVGHLGVLPPLCAKPWLYGWFAAIQGITERTAG